MVCTQNVVLQGREERKTDQKRLVDSGRVTVMITLFPGFI